MWCCSVVLCITGAVPSEAGAAATAVTAGVAGAAGLAVGLALAFGGGVDADTALMRATQALVVASLSLEARSVELSKNHTSNSWGWREVVTTGSATAPCRACTERGFAPFSAHTRMVRVAGLMATQRLTHGCPKTWPLSSFTVWQQTNKYLNVSVTAQLVGPRRCPRPRTCEISLVIKVCRRSRHSWLHTTQGWHAKRSARWRGLCGGHGQGANGMLWGHSSCCCLGSGSQLIVICMPICAIAACVVLVVLLARALVRAAVTRR